MKRQLAWIATAAIFSATVAAASELPPQPGPELRAYDVWVGDWQYEGEILASPLAPAGRFAGKQTVRWILNGFFLEFRWEEKGPLGDLGAVELDWYDAATKTYPFQGFQNNGDIYSAAATVHGNVWKNSGTVTHQETKYQTRGVIMFAADGMSLTWESEVSTDGKAWQIYARGKATKVTPTASAASVEQELMALEHAWARAGTGPDTRELDRMIADEWILTLPDGTQVTKADDLAKVAAGGYANSTYAVSHLKARVYGDAATVIGRWTETPKPGTSGSVSTLHFTDTWVRRDGRWQCVVSHVSKIAPS